MFNKKRVDVKPQLPIYTLRVPITGPVFDIELSTGDISNCLSRRAFVTEILEDGTKLPLNFSNYNKDNNKKVEKVKDEAIIPSTETLEVPAKTIVVDKEELNIEPNLPDENATKVSEETIEATLENVNSDAKGEETIVFEKPEEVAEVQKQYFNGNQNQKNKVVNNKK